MYLEGLPEAPSDSDLESDLKDLPQDEDEGDGEGDGNQDTKDPRSATLSEQLARLTKTGGYGGRSVVNFSEKNARRRVMRKGGLRDQVADFFTAVLKETNAVRGLGKFPLKLESVMEKWMRAEICWLALSRRIATGSWQKGPVVLSWRPGARTGDQCWGSWPLQTCKVRSRSVTSAA